MDMAPGDRLCSHDVAVEAKGVDHLRGDVGSGPARHSPMVASAGDRRKTTDDCAGRLRARCRRVPSAGPGRDHRAATVTAVAKLVYSAITSLDGYTTDDSGNIDWSAPGPEVLKFINEVERGFGTYLYGRRMYETMVYWETFDAAEDEVPSVRDYAGIWRGAAKVVYTRTLDSVSSAATRIERAFDPAAVRHLKETAGHDLSVGGPDLAGQAMAAGLVDEIHLFVIPVTLGGGTPALPDRFRSDLELLGVDHFGSGVVHLQYRIGR